MKRRSCIRRSSFFPTNTSTSLDSAGRKAKTRIESLKYVYVVKFEHRNNVCGSNEYGEIESVDIDNAFKNLEDAEEHVRSMAEEKMEDGEDLE